MQLQPYSTQYLQINPTVFLPVSRKQYVGLRRQEISWGIKVLDHVIIGDGEYLSFVEKGLL
jgi:hypothetical protein